MQSGKTVRIHQVGRLFVGQEGRMQFMPDEEMERILRSFGLKRIPLQPINQSNESMRSLPAKRIIPLPRLEEQRAEAPWLRIAAAIAVPVLGGAGMFFMDGMDGEAALMSTLPVHIQSYEEARYQPRFEEEAIPVWEVIADPAAASTTVTKSEEKKNAAENGELSTSTVSIKSVVATKNDAVFLLVAGSFSVESNAQNLSKDLSEKGFDSEVFKQENGLHLVTFATHFEEGQARRNLAELRSDESTKRAWLKRVGQVH
jgi:cell division septation protein DedD